MSIATTLGTLIKANAALQELATYKMTGKAGYDASRFIAKAQDALEAYNKAKQASVEKYGVFDEKAGGYRFLTESAIKAAQADEADLSATEVVFEVSKLTFEALEKMNPTVGLWAWLDWAIEPPKV